MGGIQRDWGSELGREVPNHAHLTPSKQPKVLQAVSLCREGAERKQELRGKGSLHFYLLPVDLSFIKYEGIFFCLWSSIVMRYSTGLLADFANGTKLWNHCLVLSNCSLGRIIAWPFWCNKDSWPVEIDIPCFCSTLSVFLWVNLRKLTRVFWELMPVLIWQLTVVRGRTLHSQDRTYTLCHK